jgi:hypothetical protein
MRFPCREIRRPDTETAEDERGIADGVPEQGEEWLMAEKTPQLSHLLYGCVIACHRRQVIARLVEPLAASKGSQRPGSARVDVGWSTASMALVMIWGSLLKNFQRDGQGECRNLHTRLHWPPPSALLT